ncbi:MAG: carbohydrate kinase [Firmicutes bacterium]|nr:carbohydrate kinase [Bacillota bacterium]
MYYLGIDNGGTGCRAVLFTKDGRQVAAASEALTLDTPGPGRTERDMEALWDANCHVIRAVIEKAGIDAGEIRAIACCGHGKGLYLWGKDNKPAYPGIVSTDGRAWAYSERWQRDGTADHVFERACQQTLACQPPAILCWLKDNDPAVLESIRWIFEVKDYIRFCLTGEAHAELTDMSGTGMLNLHTRAYDRELLTLYGLEALESTLPPLVGSTALCGAVSEDAAARTGLIAGTPVAGGMFDIDACAAAAGITGEANIAVIAGTWSINEYIAKIPVLDRSVKMNSLYCLNNYYLIEESSATSASNLAWFIDMFMPELYEEAKTAGMNVYVYYDSLAASVTPEEQSLIFLPYLYGSNDDPRAKATLLGLDSHHTRAHIARAVLEGICFCHKVHVNRLLRNREHTRAVRLAGGAAKSALWCQLFADIFELPVERVAADELGALGCAMAAAVAVGDYDSLEDAAAHMTEVAGRFEPNHSTFEAYREKYRLYCDVSAALDPLWADLTD